MSFNITLYRNANQGNRLNGAYPNGDEPDSSLTAPSGLSVSLTSSTALTPSWTDNSASEIGFQVQRSPNGSTGWTTITTTAANVTSYADTGLSPSTAYYYRVRATDGSSFSDWSNTASATTSGAGAFPWDPNRSLASSPYYLAASGGSDSNDGSIGSPWATFAYAVTQLSAGDTLYLRAGTHDISGEDIAFQASGTAGNLIEVTSYPGEEPVIDCGGTFGIGIYGCSYWRFSHLFLQNYTSGISLGFDAFANNMEIYSIDGSTTLGGDNVGLVLMNGSGPVLDFSVDRVRHTFVGDNTLIVDNSAGICVVDQSAPNLNNTAVWSGVFDHIEVYNAVKGFYIKIAGLPGATSNRENVTIRNSFTSGNRLFGLGENHQEYKVENCVFNDEVRFSEDASPSGGDWNTLDHCTFLGDVFLRDLDFAGGVPVGSEHSRNNVFTDCLIDHLHISDQSTIIGATDYNLFVEDIETDYNTTPVDLNLAAWQTANSTDANSLQGTPTYVGADKSVIANCGLASGIGVNAASDGTDIGANVGLVGVSG